VPEPIVAVVIPVYKHAALVGEAIESVLQQDVPFDYRIVIVNDGCPFVETDQICREYARVHPERIRYLHTRNQGLSRARNTGIETVLSLWPSVRAVQMLDSDDRLGPHALRRASDALDATPDAGWAYPNCTRFDFSREYADVGGPWSILELLAANYVQTASMVRRELLERGLRYDEQMRLGYEDWEFWIRCAASGWRGVHVPEMDFRYRRRGESMLEDSMRNDAAIVAYVRDKHAWLYRPRFVMEREQLELPRYAIYLSDLDRIVVTSDPSRTVESFNPPEFLNQLARVTALPRRTRFPSCFVVTSSAFLSALQRARLDAGLFWHLQTRSMLADARLFGASFVERAGVEWSCAIDDLPPGSDPPATPPGLMMLSMPLLESCLRDAVGKWLRDVQSGLAPGLRSFTVVRTTCRTAVPAPFPDASEALSRFIYEHSAPYRSLPCLDMLKARPGVRPWLDAADVTRRLLASGPILPRVNHPSRIEIAFVVPICDFGGAERGTHNYGREARRRGWVPHLFVVGSASARLLDEFRDVFETVTLVGDPAMHTPERLLGLLGTMDVVVNNNCAHLNAASSLLRRAGVKIVSKIHSVTIPENGPPCGQPYETVRYEHAIDAVITVSQKLRRWCRAQGIPDQKLIHVPNAASFEVSEAELRTTMLERADRTSAQPLRALFLGRFDQEKGMDRLVALCEAASASALPIDWQIVGKRVVHQRRLREINIDSIRPFIHPPALTSTALTRMYRWADIVIMLSRFEGAPLTILEAQRFGCVFLSTDVGAIDELIVDDRTGFLFSNELDNRRLVAQVLHRLQLLHADRGRMLEVGRAAATVRRDQTWAKNFEPLANLVESWFPDRVARVA